MSSTRYIFSPLFLFHWFSQVVTNFTFTSETPVILLLLKFLPSNPAKKRLVKNGEHKLEKPFFDGIRGDVQLRHFILLSVPISQRLSRLTSLYFFSFLKWPLKLVCTFCWQLSVLLNNWLPLLKAGNYFLASNKLQSTLQAVLTLVIYPFSFVSSIECTKSSILTGKNTYCTTFKIMWFKPFGLISINGSGFLSQVKSNLFKYQSTM